jgi:hypothetical protein
MTSTVAQLRPEPPVTPPPPVDPLREALKTAINKHCAISVKASTLLEAIERARSDAAEADAAVKNAQKAIDEARERDVHDQAAAVVRGKKAAGGRVRAARAELVDLQDEAELAHGVVSRLEDELQPFHDQLVDAEVEILIARAALVEPLIEQASAKMLAAHFEQIRLGQLLSVLTEDPRPAAFKDLDPVRSAKIASRIDNAIAAAAEKADAARTVNAHRDYEAKVNAAAEIRAMLEALSENADAPLPQI